METACGRIALGLIRVLSRPKDQFLRCAPASRERVGVFGNVRRRQQKGLASRSLSLNLLILPGAFCFFGPRGESVGD